MRQLHGNRKRQTFRFIQGVFSDFPIIYHVDTIDMQMSCWPNQSKLAKPQSECVAENLRGFHLYQEN